MDKAEFDRFADEYHAMHRANIGASGEDPEYFADYKMRDFAGELARRHLPNAGRSFLDFGAGTGNSIPHFHRHVPDAHLHCADVSSRSLQIAEQRFGPAAKYFVFDGSRLPFDDETFTGCFACCVFHHIPADLHADLLIEIRRVLRPGGIVMIYEHNPLNPLTVRAVNTCPFDANAVLVGAARMSAAILRAGFENADTRYRVFFPRVLNWLRWAEPGLVRVPLGAQYYALGEKQCR